MTSRGLGHRDHMAQALAVPPEADPVRLPFAVSSVAAARGMVADALAALGVERPVIDDASAVVGELVMNAVRHGRPCRDGSVEVAWSLVPDALRFSVRDGGRVERLEARMPTATAVGGRGLAMVAVLSRRWGYDLVDGTRVVADIPVPADAMP